MSGALRTQIYLTAEQRAGLNERGRAERKTMAAIIRDAIDSYLAADVSDSEREELLASTFGASAGIADRMPSRDEWDR